LINIFFGGFVLAQLWAWFIVPLGAIAITYTHAVGISCLINTVLGSRGYSESNDDEPMQLAMFKMLLFSILIPAGTLATGWFIK
jgi:hypothetical protein